MVYDSINESLLYFLKPTNLLSNGIQLPGDPVGDRFGHSAYIYSPGKSLPLLRSRPKTIHVL